MIKTICQIDKENRSTLIYFLIFIITRISETHSQEKRHDKRLQFLDRDLKSESDSIIPVTKVIHFLTNTD